MVIWNQFLDGIMTLKWDYYKFVFHTNLNHSKLESALDSLTSYADTYIAFWIIEKETDTTCGGHDNFPFQIKTVSTLKHLLLMKYEQIIYGTKFPLPLNQHKTNINLCGGRDLKLVPAIFYQIFIFWSNDRPSKAMKNVFYFS